MKVSTLPVISIVFEAGADDRVLDSLLLVGPLLIGLVAVLDRSLVTEVLAFAYITLVVTYPLYQGVRG